MKKRAIIKKIIWILLIMLCVVLIIYRENFLQNNCKESNEDNGNLDNVDILEINIIDKYNQFNELDKKEEYKLIDLRIGKEYYKEVGIRTKGSTVYYLLEKNDSKNYSYKIKLDYKNKKQNYKGITELHLNTGIPDPTGIREYLVYKIYNQMGINTQKYGLGELKLDNKSLGLISVVEVVNENYINRNYNLENANLYKPDPYLNHDHISAGLNYNGDEEENYRAIFDNVKTLKTNKEDKTRLINILKSINKEKEIEKYFYDFDKIIKMIAINKVVGDIDSFTGKTLRNYYLYEANGKIDIIPFDFNISFGVNANGDLYEEDIYDLTLSRRTNGNSILLDIIRENDVYANKYQGYVRETINILKNINLDELVYETKEIVKNNERKFYHMTEYEQGIKDLKDFINLRTMYL